MKHRTLLAAANAAAPGLVGLPADLKATIVADRRKWAEVIKEAGMRAD